MTEPIINPSDTKRYLAKVRNTRPEDLRLPEALLVTYSPREFDHGKNLIGGKPVEWWPYEGRLAVGRINQREIAISHSFVGAPGAVMMLEELISHGAKRIVEAGLSGGIDPSLEPGDLCIISEAFSDEGTSRHYYPRRRTFKPSPSLTSHLKEATKEEDDLKVKTSAVWTTDAPYRETKAKVNKFRSLGARLVNMETSSIFALGEFRKVHTASIQVVSDIVLPRNRWKPAFRFGRVLQNRQVMLRIAGKVLAEAL